MDGGMSYLASTSLMLKSVICLQLAHNRIGDSGIQDFCARMRSFECLAELDLRCECEGCCTYQSSVIFVNCSVGVMAWLCVCCCDRRWNPLSEASAISISKSLKHNRCRLRLLDLSFTAVGDAGVASIAHALRTNSTLQTLRLNNTNAAEEAAIALTAACQVNTALTELAIAGNPFNDVGGVCFWEIFTASHPTLRFLSLSGCGISDVSARTIAENIAFCQSLTELDLSFNRVSKRTAENAELCTNVKY